MEDQISIKEAAISSLQSMENLVLTLSTPSYSLSSSSSHQFDCKEITDQTVSKLKKFISVLDRTGRARFRRGPVQPPPVTSPPQTHTLDFTKPRSDSCGKVTGKSQLFYDAFSLSLGSSADGKIFGKCQFSDDTFNTSPPISGNSSFLSSITADGSVTCGNLLNPTPGGKVSGKCQFLDDSFSISSPISGNASLLSSITADGSVTGGKVAVSNGRLTLSSSKKKDDSSGNHTPSASRCIARRKGRNVRGDRFACRRQVRESPIYLPTRVFGGSTARSPSRDLLTPVLMTAGPITSVAVSGDAPPGSTWRGRLTMCRCWS